MPSLRTRYWVALWLLPCVFIARTAEAQSATSAAVDRPSQRWIPLPTGNQPDLQQQALLLRQLREMASFSKDVSQPALDEQQLQQMERAFEALRNQLGDVQLPPLENIPPQWIDQALADPNIQQRAQRLLEQYARDRQLTPAQAASRLAASAGVPLPSGAESNQAAVSCRTASPSALAPPSSDKRAASATDSPATRMATEGTAAADRSQPSQLPGAADAEQLQALKRLFEKLAANEGRQNAGPFAPRSPATDSRSDPPPQNADNSRGAATTTNPAAGPNLGRASSSAARKRANPAASPAAARPTAQSSPTVTRDSQTRPESPQSPSAGMPQDPGRSPALGPTSPPAAAGEFIPRPASSPSGTAADTSEPKPPAYSPTGEPRTTAEATPSSSKTTNPTAATLNTMRTSATRPNSTANSNRITSQSSGTDSTPSNPAPPRSAGSGSSAVERELDVKRLVERRGLGGALRSIVEKAIREQATNSPGGETASASEDSFSLNRSLPGWAQSRSESQTPSATIQSSQPPRTTASNGRSSSTPSSPRSSGRTSATQPSASAAGTAKSDTAVSRSQAKPPNHGFMEMVADVWQAVSTAPNADRASAASSSAAAGNLVGPAKTVRFQWERLGWAAAALAITLGLLYWHARRRAQLGNQTTQETADWVREMLKTGIRTRADVVRAFHYFVRQRPVPDWRTHRFVADRLCAASPHLQSVILELTSVYEQARYLPPEEKLSDEQIVRMQTALQQCDSCPV